MSHLGEGKGPTFGEELPYRYATTKADVAQINLLFEELGVILRMEEEISEQKLRLVREEYELIQKEGGTYRQAA